MNKKRSVGAQLKRALVVLAVAGLVPAGSALAALELRDINGSPTAVSADAEFAYDTVLGATWYLTANNTPMTWDNAKSWAAGLTVGTFSGWSLPSATDNCFGYDCTNSQMGELYYTALGNPAGGPLTTTSPFKNLQSYDYWSGTEYALDPGSVWLFNTSFGTQNAIAKNVGLYALAVRPGDVAAVPEPGTVALLLSGLAGVMVMRRRPVGS